MGFLYVGVKQRLTSDNQPWNGTVTSSQALPVCNGVYFYETNTKGRIVIPRMSS